MVTTRALTVYKASAGSGKTFTLAVEYIKLLVTDPQAFRQTLAVTFTNKATEEMKMRILSQLYGIWRGLDNSKAYSDIICKEMNAEPAYVAEQAGKALKLLLHNYSYFRVETIDSFFQSVLRNLARELDLTANLRIGLNDNQVEELAVDQLIDSLQATDLMLQWLLRFIMDNIDADLSWNVIGQIKKFGKTIFRDYYKQHSREMNKVLADPDFLSRYADMLRDERQKASERMKEIAESFFDTIAREGLTVDDFSNKSRGVCSIFLKIRQGTLDESIITKTTADAVGNPAKWYTKSNPRGAFIHALVENELDPILRFAISEQPRQWRLFQSADLTLRHLSQLRLLGSIETKVRELNETSNRFLLSDTQQLLHDLIDGSDTPFVFEKIGTQLEHIMIDEFQDTSTVQWQNFKVLLEEALSHQGSSNLIVGDVKQSIYRWRSGDWRLLDGIGNQFSNASQHLTIKSLDTNFRSCRNIIEFNNAFFTEAARQEEAPAYSDVSQKWPAGKAKEGLVCVKLISANDYQQNMLNTVAKLTGKLLKDGIEPGKIAILVRSNGYIPLIANELMTRYPDVKVVSDEAFRLDASPAVQVIISALRYLQTPDDAITKAFLAKAYSGRLDGQLPEAFANHREELLRLPLYDLTEQLYSIFIEGDTGAMDHQSAYLCCFYDQVATFVNEHSADLMAFLNEWDENICGKTIQSPESNGLHIISIHKSKGLEFDNVIIPFCDWKLEHADIIWCHPKEEPFSQLPLVPVNYSQKGMKGTIYEQDYEEEHSQNTVDNLNLLYVAFTRASHNLFVLGKRGSKTSRSVLIEQVLPKLQLEGGRLIGVEDESAPLYYVYGHLLIPPKTSDSSQPLPNPNPFLQPPMPVSVNIEVCKQKATFKQSNRSRDFIMADDEQQEQSQFIQLGSVLHNLFSTIHSLDDTDNALRELEQEGIIYNSEITHERLADMIRKRMANPQVQEWFAPGKWTLYNECSILMPNGQERRPDRVMTNGRETIVVDFKFGRERDEYHQQVREYMQLLQEMGLPAVRGYLWLVYSNRIIEVYLKEEI